MTNPTKSFFRKSSNEVKPIYCLYGKGAQRKAMWNLLYLSIKNKDYDCAKTYYNFLLLFS